MTYQNPLHLLPDFDYSSGFSAAHLKKWRKELLLQFQLTEETTIEIKGQQYDKNTILEAFAALEKNADFHVRMYNNQPLLDLIEQGELAFFYSRNRASWKDFEDPLFVQAIRPYLVPRLSKMIYKYVAHASPYGADNLRTICNSNFDLPQALEGEIYANTYAHLQQFSEASYLRCTQPFASIYPLRYTETIVRDMNLHYLNIFKLLPASFQPLAIKYAKGARQVLYQTTQQIKHLNEMKSSDLMILQNAAEIDWVIRGAEDARQVMQSVKVFREQNVFRINYNNPQTNFSESYSDNNKSDGIKAVVYFILFCFFITGFVSLNGNKKRSSNYYKPPNYSLDKPYSLDKYAPPSYQYTPPNRSGIQQIRSTATISKKWIGLETVDGEQFHLSFIFSDNYTGILYYKWPYDQPKYVAEVNFEYTLHTRTQTITLFNWSKQEVILEAGINEDELKYKEILLTLMEKKVAELSNANTISIFEMPALSMRMLTIKDKVYSNSSPY